MTNIVPHPALALDRAVSDIAAQIKVLHALAQCAEDAEWLRLRHAVTDMLCMLGEQCSAADAPIARMMHGGRS